MELSKEKELHKETKMNLENLGQTKTSDRVKLDRLKKEIISMERRHNSKLSDLKNLLKIEITRNEELLR